MACVWPTSDRSRFALRRRHNTTKDAFVKEYGNSSFNEAPNMLELFTKEELAEHRAKQQATGRAADKLLGLFRTLTLTPNPNPTGLGNRPQVGPLPKSVHYGIFTEHLEKSSEWIAHTDALFACNTMPPQHVHGKHALPTSLCFGSAPTLLTPWKASTANLLYRKDC